MGYCLCVGLEFSILYIPPLACIRIVNDILYICRPSIYYIIIVSRHFIKSCYSCIYLAFCQVYTFFSYQVQSCLFCRSYSIFKVPRTTSIWCKTCICRIIGSFLHIYPAFFSIIHYTCYIPCYAASSKIIQCFFILSKPCISECYLTILAIVDSITILWYSCESKIYYSILHIVPAICIMCDCVCVGLEFSILYIPPLIFFSIINDIFFFGCHSTSFKIIPVPFIFSKTDVRKCHLTILAIVDSIAILWYSCKVKIHYSILYIKPTICIMGYCLCIRLEYPIFHIPPFSCNCIIDDIFFFFINYTFLKIIPLIFILSKTSICIFYLAIFAIINCILVFCRSCIVCIYYSILKII